MVHLDSLLRWSCLMNHVSIRTLKFSIFNHRLVIKIINGLVYYLRQIQNYKKQLRVNWMNMFTVIYNEEVVANNQKKIPIKSIKIGRSNELYQAYKSHFMQLRKNVYYKQLDEYNLLKKTLSIKENKSIELTSKTIEAVRHELKSNY